MRTLAVYDMIASAFLDMLNKADSSTKEAYESSMRESINKVQEWIKRFRKIDPIQSPILFNGETTVEKSLATELIDRISECAKNRSQLEAIYTGTSCTKIVQELNIEVPRYVDITSKPHILLGPYASSESEKNSVKVLNQIVMGAMLSLPKGEVKVNIINPSYSDKAELLIKNLPRELCIMYTDPDEIKELLESMKGRIKDYLKNGGIVQQAKYELLVLLDYPHQYDGLTERMQLIVQQGKQAGIHFIVIEDLRYTLESKDSFDLLSFRDDYFHEIEVVDNKKTGKSEDDFLFRTYELCEQPELLKLCCDYLNDSESFTQKNKTGDFPAENVAEYVVVERGLTVSVGEPIGKQTMDFCLGQDGHVHSFIIGQTGKGKSVLLNNIIIKAIQKYSPEDLQLYLLDLKLGGVGFNRYKEVKHVRALLVDNTDIQIILEILRDLSEQMYKRGNLLRETGVEKIDDYNKANPDNRMSRIWVVIDECHVLFEHNSNSEGKAMREISKILSKVATEGRNQGVHLIMATQTLANSDIPTEILNQFTDRYILNCAHNDSERLCSDSSRLTSKFGKGDVYYHNTGDIPDTQFHTFYISEEGTKSQISTAVAKAEKHQSNGQFYFNGSLLFNIDKDILDRIGVVQNNNLIACAGKSISLHQEPVLITLKKDFGENILLTGINEKNQSTRTASDILFSLIASNVLSGNYYKFYVFDYRKEEDVENQDIFEQLEEAGFITVLRNKTIGSHLKKFVSNIKNERLCPTIILVLSQQRSRELKLNLLIKEDDTNQELKGGWFGKNGFINPPKVETESSKEVKTYIDALCYILDNGPDYHIHTILQVDKPDNLLFQDFFPRNFIFSKFRHLIMLHSDDKAATKLGVSDEMRLDKLNSENERLRAIYYADGDDGWTLFSPFVKPNKELILSITNKEQ